MSDRGTKRRRSEEQSRGQDKKSESARRGAPKRPCKARVFDEGAHRRDAAKKYKQKQISIFQIVALCVRESLRQLGRDIPSPTRESAEHEKTEALLARLENAQDASRASTGRSEKK